MKVAEINGKEYAVIPMRRKISIDGGGGVTPYILEKAERIDGTDYYKATFKDAYGDTVYRVVEFEK